MTFANSISVLQRWIDGLNEGHAEEVASLYADVATLLPTFSPRALRTSDERRSYFESLAARPGLWVSLHEKTLHNDSFEDGRHIFSGIYYFEFPVDGETLRFEARFTLVLDLSKTAPILHHHSSQVPRALT